MVESSRGQGFVYVKCGRERERREGVARGWQLGIGVRRLGAPTPLYIEV
jgi:hypothetical protein